MGRARHQSIIRNLNVILWLILSAILESSTVFAGQRTSFDDHWLFIKGDPPGVSNQLAYATVKKWVEAGGAEF
ncbi:MAG: hypothetical protein ACREFR_11565, partial [Limisphaerales bacterium]